MNTLKILLVGVLLLIFNSIISAQVKDLKSYPSMEALLKEAQLEKKLILIDCYYTGCPPCALMDNKVLTHPMVSDLLKNNFVIAKFDVFNSLVGDTICYRYAVTGFPTFLVLDEKGNLVEKFSGFRDVPQFYNILLKSQDKAKSKQFFKGFSSVYSHTYPDFYRLRHSKNRPKTSQDEIRAFVTSKNDWIEEKTALVIMSYISLMDEAVQNYFVDNFASFCSLYGNELAQKPLIDIFTSRLVKAIDSQGEAFDFMRFLSEIKPGLPQENLSCLKQSLAEKFYVELKNDNSAFLRFMSENPVVYNNMILFVLQQWNLNEELYPVFNKWTCQVVDENCSIEIINAATEIAEKANDAIAFNKFNNMKMLISKKFNLNEL
jgi:thioredoxin-related protein